MKGPEKWLSTGRLRRTVLLLGVAGATAAAALLTAASGAQAVTSVGSEPGNLVFNPPSGPATAGQTAGFWSTTDGCPAGFQGSATLRIIDSNGVGSVASPVINAVTAPFSGSLLASVANSQALGTSIPFGQPVEWAVDCFSGPANSGNSEFVQSTDVTISADGSTYTSGITTVLQTTTTLSAPTSAKQGATVTLSATVTGQDGSHPAGTVTFTSGSTTIGSSPTDTSGNASVQTSFSNLGPVSVQAAFTPADPTTVGPSSSSVQTITITSSSALDAVNSPVTINVTVAATGTLTVTVDQNTGVNLTVNGLVATGTLPNVTINDNRNTFPGWSVMGQIAGGFQGPGSNTISGDALGWAPNSVSGLLNGAVLGPTVSPNAPGLGTTAALLESAPAGSGSGAQPNVVNAVLTLDIPSSQAAGAYTGQLAITYLDSGS